MGAYLDTPNKEKHSQNGKNDTCAWGATGMQGWRTGMEDAHIAIEMTLPATGKKGMLFGVFDGHGGQEVAAHAEIHFKDVLENLDAFKKGNYKEALTKAFLDYDSKVENEDFSMDTGTTACVVLITPDKIFCSNAGDSRGCLSRKGKEVPLSYDHKPQNDEEIKRIQKANHFVEDDRVDGNLALSRAFGDFQFKDQKSKSQQDQAVTSNPDVLSFDRTKDDEFIVLACDGIWDCVSNQECITRVAKEMKDTQAKDTHLAGVVEQLLDDILAPNTDEGIGTDNMTAIVIKLYNK